MVMKPLVFAAALLVSTTQALAQPTPSPAPDWSAFKPLLGEWVADPGPDGATGGFTLALDLEGRVLVRKNHAEFAKTKERPASRHEDLLVAFKDGEATRATYWDNEGHVIEYVVTIDGEKFSFVSRAVAEQPQLRLTYEPAPKGKLSITFEIAPPGSGGAFRPYLKATAHRK